jgi:hypothetical protein
MAMNRFDTEFADKLIQECNTFEDAQERIWDYAEETGMSDQQEEDLSDYIRDGIDDKPE